MSSGIRISGVRFPDERPIVGWPFVPTIRPAEDFDQCPHPRPEIGHWRTKMSGSPTHETGRTKSVHKTNDSIFL